MSLDTRLKQAMGLHQAGDRAGAIEVLESLLKDVDSADVHFFLANVLREGKDFAGALSHYGQALRLEADHRDAALNLGLTLKALGQLDDAVHCFQTAMATMPKAADFPFNLGVVYWAQKQYTKAEEAYRKALELDPRNSQFHYNLGILLETTGHHQEAVFHLKKAHDLTPNKPQFSVGLAQSCLSLRDFSKADEIFAAVFDQDPDHLEAHLGKARAYFLQGDLESGWREYNWRHERPQKKVTAMPGKKWNGMEPLKNKSILVYGEQGHGDIIQFSRYLPLLAERGAEVTFACPQPLNPLLEGLGAEINLIAPDQSRPVVDYHIHLLDIPGVLGTTLETIPNRIPYISGLIPRTSSRLPLKIGIQWAGDPGHPKDATRSCTFEDLSALFEVEGLEFYSLQKDDTGVTLKNPPLKDLGSQFEDFAQTARAMLGLDLILTVDTSTAHLAGALGLPVWTLLPFAPDWRWMLDREDTPWYPTMRLFRQPRPRDWSSVFDQVRNALMQLQESKS